MNATNAKFMLEVQNLNKKFGDVHAVKNLNFQVRRGEVFGFLGPNGAGKTTTMRMVTCFIPSTSGSVLVDGMNTVENSLHVRQKIGYLPENNPLYNDMTVREYLNFVGEIRGMAGQKLNARVDEMFHICSLTNMAQRQIGKLSKGYRQRVGLAQAMMHNPDLLILDEPMSGLDPNQIIEIRGLIKKIGEEKTVIYCSHILPEVAATCSRILIINEGAIVASGTPDELTSLSTKSNKYQIRVKGEKGSIERGFSLVNGVAKVSLHDTAPGWYSAEVVSSEKDDIGESLFRCAVDNGWALAELRHESASLEDVFTQLTRS